MHKPFAEYPLVTPTIRHFLALMQHRRRLLVAVSSMAVRHMAHFLGAMSRLGLNEISDDKSAERVFDLMFEDQAMPAGRNSRRMTEFIHVIPWEMYLCLLYVELEGYRSAAKREPTLVFPPLEHFLKQKAPVVETLKTFRDKVLHPAKDVDLDDALGGFMQASTLADGHYYQTTFNLHRELDNYLLWLGVHVAQLSSAELAEAKRLGRSIPPAKLELMSRAVAAMDGDPPILDDVVGQSSRQTPFDLWKWSVLGLYREIHLERTSGPRPELLRKAKTDGMRMLMRSLVCANECVHLIHFDKFRSIKTRTGLESRDPFELLIEGTPATTDQEVQNLFAPWRVSCAMLSEPLRLYNQTVEAMPLLRRPKLDEALSEGDVRSELARYRNQIFHLTSDGGAKSDIEHPFMQGSSQGATITLRILPLLLDFFMDV